MDKEWLETTVRINDQLLARVLAVYDAHVQRTVQQSGRVLKRRTTTELRTREHVAERDLENSLHTEIRENSVNGWLVSLTTLDIAANALEYGTEPTADETPVNVSNIVVWLEEKGIEPDYGTIEDYAYAIARKIGALGMTVDGIPVKSNQRRPFNAAQKKASREINALWQEMVDNMVGELNRLG